MSRDDERVDDVRVRFMRHGRALVFSKPPEGFVALFPWRGTRGSAPPRAYGRTRAEAAENAWAEFERLRDEGRL